MSLLKNEMSRGASSRSIIRKHEFANAGTGSPFLGKITAEHIDEIFDTNVKDSIFTVQKALPLMAQDGSIILTGSSAGTTGAPAFSAYSASKAAVRNLDLGGGSEGHRHPGKRAVARASPCFHHIAASALSSQFFVGRPVARSYAGTSNVFRVTARNTFS
jgi:short chain dehydrogenase